MTASHSQYFSTSPVRLNETAQQSIDSGIAVQELLKPVLRSSLIRRTLSQLRTDICNHEEET